MFGKFLVLWCLVDASLSTHVPSFMYEQAPPEPATPRLASIPFGHHSNPLVLSKDKQQGHDDDDEEEDHKRLAIVTETLTLDNRDVKSIEQPIPQSEINEKTTAATTTSLVDVRDFTEHDETTKSTVPASASSLDNTKFRATTTTTNTNTATEKNTDTATTNLANTLDTTNSKESSSSSGSSAVSIAAAATKNANTQADVKNAANTRAHLAATSTDAGEKKISGSTTTVNDASQSKTTDNKLSVAVPSVAIATTGVTTTNTNEGAQKSPSIQLLTTPPSATVSSGASTSASPHSAVITITITTTNGGEISALPSVAPASSTTTTTTIPSTDSFKQKSTEAASPPLPNTPPISPMSASLPSGSGSGSGSSDRNAAAAVSDNSNVANTPEQEQQLQSDQASEQLQAQEEEEDAFAQARALETSNQARALAENTERVGTSSEFGPGDPTYFSNWKPGTVADKRTAYLAGQGLLSPYPGLPVSRPRRAPRYPAPPFRSVEDYRLYREAQKQGLIAPADPLRMPTGQPLYPSEPFGAWGNADFVGDNMVVQPFGASGNPAKMGKLSSLKTTPGISCDSWRSCSECTRFSFCVWNDEGQSCRQEIDVIFSAVHQKYSKRCPMAGPRGDFAGPRRARETPAMFPDLSPSPPYMGTSSDMFEPPYYRRERIRAGLARDLQKGQMKGLWRTPQERVNWFSPDAPPSSRQTPELRFRQKPLIDATLEAKPEERSSTKKGIHLVHQDPPRFMSLTKVV